MKLWQQISVLSLGCAVAATSYAGVIVDRTETGSVSVHVDGNETNTVQSDNASKLSLKSTRSKIDESERIEVEVEGEKSLYDDRTRAKKDKVQLNAIGNSPVQVSVGSSDTETTETSTVDVNALGGAKVDVALDSDTSETAQTNFVEVNAIGVGEEGTFIDVDNTRRVRRDDAGEMSIVVSGRIGLDVADVGEDQYIRTTHTSPDKYTYDDDWDSALVWGLFGGVEMPIADSDTFSWQTGFAYYNTNDIDVTGQIFSQGDPSLDDKEFSYSVSNQRFMWENKLLAALDDDNLFSVYLLGGIGLAINKVSDYDERILDPRVGAGPDFEDKTSNSFSYSVGLGLEMAVIEQLRVGLGYQYSDLGKVELGDADEDGTNSSQSLSSTNTPTNEVVLGLTYLFN